MIIYLRHPLHGVKVAYQRNEAEEDKRNGWEEYIPSAEAPIEDIATPSRDVIKLKKG